MAAAKKTTKKATAVKTGSTTAGTKKSVSKTTSSKKATVKKTKAVPAKATSKKEVKNTSPKKAAAPKATKAVKKAEPKKAEKKEVVKTTKKTVAPKKTDVFRCPISGIPVKAEKPNLSDKTLAKLKELLIEERVRHLAQMDELTQEAVDMITDREAGDTQFDEESGEGDSVAVERERTLFLAAEAQNTVDQIDRALGRMKDHSYGLCVPSGRRISVPRLEALPWTEVCVDCKARSERRR